MPSVPLPLTTRPGRWPGEYAGRLINTYVEKDGENYRWKRVPGLTEKCAVPGQYRGALLVDDLLYAVVGLTAVKIAADGAVTTLTGTVAGTGPVTMARNNRADGPDVVCVSSAGAYVLSPTAVSSYPDADLPQPISVDVLDGYFIFAIEDGRLFASDLNSTAVDALNVAKAQAKPDGLRRAVSYAGYMWAFGSTSIEVYQDVGTQYWPLARVSVIPMGLRSTFAVAGGEDGWSGSLFFVAEDGSVQELTGASSAQRISPPDLERLISEAPRESLWASVYTFEGNLIFVLSSDDWTWEYDTALGSWRERQSDGLTRWRLKGGVQDVDGSWVGGDTLSNRLLRIDTAAKDEAGAALIATVGSVPLKSYPARSVIPNVFLDITLGHGDPAGGSLPLTNPRVRTRWSLNGGGTWTNPIDREIGPVGRYVGPVRINRLGLASHHGVIFEFSVSDPVDYQILGAWCEQQTRAP